MSPSLPPPILYSHSQHAHLIPSIARIHAACILHDGTLATFLPSPTTGKMDIPAIEAFWHRNAEEVEQGSRAIALQFANMSSSDDEQMELAGYVSLYMPSTQTGPFRSSVEKLMVSPDHRRKGVARRVMAKLEEVARAERRELMILDTTIGTEAEHVYPRLGYKEFGRLPKYGISPKDGRLVDEIFYYKDLRDSQ